MRTWGPLTGAGAKGVVFPAAFLVLTIGVDLLLPERISPPLVVVLPILGMVAGIIGAAVFTVLGMAWCVVDSLMEGGQQTHDALYGKLIALAVAFVASLIPGYLRWRREGQVEKLRSVAETVQRAVLPPVPGQHGCLQLSAEYLAANTEAHIGGDLYDILDTPYGIRMIIGDVRGKGLPAVASANNLLGAFKEAAPYAATLPELAERLDDSVRRYSKRADLLDEEFITATLVSIPPDPPDPQDPRIEYVCCGHPAPLLIRAGTTTQLQATSPSPPLGVGHMSADGLNAADIQVDTATFDVGDRLLLYTDGITEARDNTGTFYPLGKRIQAWANNDPNELIHKLVLNLNQHTGGNLTDDAAVLVAQRDTRGQAQPKKVQLIRPPLQRPADPSVQHVT